MENKFEPEWNKVLSERPMPDKLRNIVEMDYEDFKSKVMSQDEVFAKNIVDSLYSGDAFVIKKAFSKEFLDELKRKTFEWGQTTPQCFHKCLEGTPNINRIVDESLSGQYNSRSIWHQHLFYRWNGDVLGMFEPLYEKWRVMKTLWGLDSNQYENNTPKDGIVDRIHIYRYPIGGGYLATHADPYKFQKTIMVVKMTQKGVDYNSGGLYFIDQNNSKVNVEDGIEIGDLYFAFPTVLHGVEAIDPSNEVNWNIIDGRWILGFYSMNSDHVDERHTVMTIEDHG